MRVTGRHAPWASWALPQAFDLLFTSDDAPRRQYAVAVEYRDPVTGDTWTDRSSTPNALSRDWLNENRGKTLQAE
jgi:hypothetical protein